MNAALLPSFFAVMCAVPFELTRTSLVENTILLSPPYPKRGSWKCAGCWFELFRKSSSKNTTARWGSRDLGEYTAASSMSAFPASWMVDGPVYLKLSMEKWVYELIYNIMVCEWCMWIVYECVYMVYEWWKYRLPVWAIATFKVISWGVGLRNVNWRTTSVPIWAPPKLTTGCVHKREGFGFAWPTTCIVCKIPPPRKSKVATCVEFPACG